jgi:integrase
LGLRGEKCLGWWVGWYESGKRKARALSGKDLADHFKHIKYTQLSSDVFTGTVLADWNQMAGEYMQAKKVQRVTEGTLYEIALSLRNFERLVGKCSSKQITQNVIDNFSHKRWKKICQDAGLTDLKFHDLRKTFGSLLAQNGVSTAVTQKLLEHSSPNLTNKVYTNVDPVLRHAADQLSVGSWL